MLRRNSCRLPQEGWPVCPLPRLSSGRICFCRTLVPLSLFRASSRPWAGPARPKASPPAPCNRVAQGVGAQGAGSLLANALGLPSLQRFLLHSLTPHSAQWGRQPPGRRAAHGQGPQGERGVSPAGSTCPPPLVEARLTRCPAHACRSLGRGYIQQ